MLDHPASPCVPLSALSLLASSQHATPEYHPRPAATIATCPGMDRKEEVVSGGDMHYYAHSARY